MRSEPATLPGASTLCRVGAAASFLLAAYCLATAIQLTVVGGPPGTALEAFQMLQANRLAGLLRLDLPTMAALPLYYLLVLGLFAALWRTAPARSALATVLIVAGVTLVIATPTPFALLRLSDKYAAAATDVARAQMEAAGEALLASDMWHGTGALLGGAVLQIGTVLISAAMIRAKGFGRLIGVLGVLAHGLDLARMLVGVVAPTAAAALMAVAGTLYPIWFLLVGRALHRAGARSEV